MARGTIGRTCECDTHLGIVQQGQEILEVYLTGPDQPRHLPPGQPHLQTDVVNAMTAYPDTCVRRGSVASNMRSSIGPTDPATRRSRPRGTGVEGAAAVEPSSSVHAADE